MKTKFTYPFTILIVLSIYILFNNSYANNVSIKTIKNVAINLFTERSGIPVNNVIISNIIEKKEKGEVVYYLIQYSGKGWAIIAADDAVYPVLAFSTTGTLDTLNIPDGTRWLLNKYTKQILSIKKDEIPASNNTISKWAYYKKNPLEFTKVIVDAADSLLTSGWGQGEYYNELCPVDANGPGGHALVGCCAVAIAQIINYWHNPWKGSGSKTYTSDYGDEYADFQNTLYNYDSMPDILNSSNLNIATLMYHCAVGVEMHFAPDISWSTVTKSKNALRDYFYFDDGLDIKFKSSYYSQWDEILHGEIDNFRPVFYSGYDAGAVAGHCWVLDGYSGDQYHMNWGWYGNWNGYYYLTELTPNGYNFGTSEKIISGIYPETDNISGTLTAAGGPYYFRKGKNVQAGQTLTIEPGTEIYFIGRYGFRIYGQLLAMGTGNDSIVFSAETPLIGWQGIKFYDLNDNPADSSKLFYCRFENSKGTWFPTDSISIGGGIYCRNSSNILIANTSIKNCLADYGGGIACRDNSGVRIRNCLIWQNSATLLGGGIFLLNSDAVLSGNNISYNHISENMNSFGGGIYCNNSNVSFEKDIIRYNIAPVGGGIYFNSSGVIMDTVTINNNFSDGFAGGISATNGSGIIINKSLIYDNTADNEGGGGLYIFDNSTIEITGTLMYNNNALYGCALTLTGNSTGTLNNCTLADNTHFSMVPADGIRIGATSNLTVYNSILWDNGDAEIIMEEGSSLNASYSVIKNGDWTGTGVTHGDPLFHSPATRDYSLTWYGFPIPDEQRSSGIDSGDPSSPADPDGTRADMGCIPYEQTYTTVPGGTVSGTFTCANSPYYVFGDIEIPVGDELIIEPCVTVLFQGDYKFEVRGRLLAEGNSSDQITIAASDTIECWQGIDFIWSSTNGQDSSKLVNCRITFGYADKGGAVSFYNSPDVLIKNCLLNKNHALEKGGAIYLDGSDPTLINNIICNNSAQNGGAIFLNYGSQIITGGIIENNEAVYGGAFYLKGADPTFSGVTIRNNNAKFGGGIYMYGGSTPVFDPVNLCNLHMNYAYGAGLDLCGIGWNGGPVAVNVDTFSVINPNSHFAYPISEYTFNIQNGIVEQTTQDLYVSMTGSDENTGTDPLNPLKTMYMAMMKIMADETDTAVVYLATGAYSEDLTGEVMPVNWRGNVSLIGTGMKTVSIYGEEKNQILYCYDDSNFHIRDLSFQDGYAEDGGAVYFDHYTYANINNVEFLNSYATGNGGGLYCNDHSSPSFDTVYIKNNTAEGSGGGIYLNSNSNPVFHKVDLYSNTANYGGGGLLARLYCDFTMDDVLIDANSASYGGGLGIDFYSDPVITNTNIINNNADTYTGYPAKGGGVSTTYGSFPVFFNVDISGNESDNIGGGMYCSSNILFKNGKINNNSALVNGGGIYLNGGTTDEKFINTEICQNQVTDNYGGAIYLISGIPEFINTTIAHNQDFNEDGAGIFCHNSNPVFKNSILWDNTPDEILLGSNGDATIEYSDIEGGWTGAGNIDSDPLFVFPTTGNFTLQETSPCIDTGNPDTTGMNLPETDLSGNPRITNGVIDMGAYEYLEGVFNKQLNITVFLEGPFNGTDMNTDLAASGMLPLSQPYNTPPWNYDGDESVAAIPNSDVVDWVLVEIRDATSSSTATPSTMVARQAGFLLSDGSIVSLDGSSVLEFTNLSFNNFFYYLVWHRNHLGIMTSIGEALSGNTWINFTVSDGGVYNSSYGGYKELAPGVWGMVAGDTNGDGDINTADKTVWGTEAGSSGYKQADNNLDSQVSNKDKNDIWLINLGDACQVPE